MDRFKSQISSIIPDEDLCDYLSEAVQASESVQDFQEVAVPIILEVGNIADSEEDANDLASALFHLKDPPIERPKEKMSAPIIMSAILQDGVEDPFQQDQLAMARTVITEVGHVEGLESDITTKKYQRNLKIETEQLEEMTEYKLEQIEEENKQFRHGMGFRRSDNRTPRHLQLTNINVTIGPLNLIENASLIVSPGNRYGLVGRNGLGKTTLMKYINSSLLHGVPDDLMIIHVEQEVPISEDIVLDSILNTDLERTELLQELTVLQNSDNFDDKLKIQKILDRLNEIGSDSAEAKASMILNALGFTDEQIHSPISSLSGGFRMRVSLAQALYINPDVLLLDEPTGHLDAPSVCWLEEYLSKSCGEQILIVVSHDKVFLDNVCTHIIHLKDKHLTLYKGNYSSFEKQFEDRCNLLIQQAEAQKKDIEHKMDFVRRLGVKAASASLAQSRLKQIKKETEVMVTPITRDPPIRFMFGMSTIAAQDNLIILKDVDFGYTPEKLIYKQLTFVVHRDTRAVIIGANGAGKSTFIKLLMGQLKPQTGFYQQVSNLRIAHFSQHHVDQLDYNITPLQFMLEKYKDQFPLTAIRAQLGKFGISGELSLQPIQCLSGGQKTRVTLASLAMMSPHLMLLDEVTNNLDMDSIDALGNALHWYKGAIIAVTHDQHFANLLNPRIYICADQNLKEFNGTFQQYRDRTKAEIRNKYFKSTANKGLV